MIVRGAPAIGVAAAMGVALGVRDSEADHVSELRRDFEQICDTIGETRPTAVNLFWAIQRMKDKFEHRLANCPLPQIKQTLVTEAQRMYARRHRQQRAMGRYGAVLLPSTALSHSLQRWRPGNLRLRHCPGRDSRRRRSGKKIHVYADETRPFLQGARLTAWELVKDNIPTTLISDNMAGAMMRQGKIAAVIVGADRIAANGDVANKIGTYTVAVLAKEHGIPFYVAAPWATIDMETPDGSKIPIEQRSSREVTHFAGKQMAPNGVKIENPAFDVTPNKYVTAIITERGVAKAPLAESLKELSTAALAT